MIGVKNSPIWVCQAYGPPIDERTGLPAVGGWISGLTFQEVYDIFWLGRITAGDLDLSGSFYPLSLAGSGDVVRGGSADTEPKQRVCGWKAATVAAIVSQDPMTWGAVTGGGYGPPENDGTSPGDAVASGVLERFEIWPVSWWYDEVAESYCVAFAGGGSGSGMVWEWDGTAWWMTTFDGGGFGFDPRSSWRNGSYRGTMDVVTPWGTIVNAPLSDNFSGSPDYVFGTMTASALTW